MINVIIFVSKQHSDAIVFPVPTPAIFVSARLSLLGRKMTAHLHDEKRNTVLFDMLLLSKPPP